MPQLGWGRPGARRCRQHRCRVPLAPGPRRPPRPSPWSGWPGPRPASPPIEELLAESFGIVDAGRQTQTRAEAVSGRRPHQRWPPTDARRSSRVDLLTIFIVNVVHSGECLADSYGLSPRQQSYLVSGCRSSVAYCSLAEAPYSCRGGLWQDLSASSDPVGRPRRSTARCRRSWTAGAPAVLPRHSAATVLSLPVGRFSWLLCPLGPCSGRSLLGSGRVLSVAAAPQQQVALRFS